jgi:hypothetical protein
MHTFHSSREKKTKWAPMEPICLYLNICRHVLKSFLHKKEEKKNGVADLQLPCNQPQKNEAYP